MTKIVFDLEKISLVNTLLLCYLISFYNRPCDGPTNSISTEFQIPSEFELLLLKMYYSDHNEILHTSR